MLDTGYLMLDTGYWMLDAGCPLSGYWLLDIDYLILVIICSWSLPLPFVFVTASLSQLQELLYQGKALYLSTCGKLID